MINAWCTEISMMLADSRLKQFGSRFRGRGAELRLNDYLLLALIIIAVPLAIWLLSRFSRQKSDESNSPSNLFHRLCAAHKLERSDKKLLRQLIKWQRLSQPAKLFLEPDRFHATNLGPDLQPQHAKFIAIREKIFGELVIQ